MIAVQKPPAFFALSPAHLHRPNHYRHPSAPVVIRPTHTPGLLAVSKPAQQQLSKQQQSQQNQRAPRQSPRGKTQRSPVSAQPQTVEDDKQSPQPKERAVAASDKATKSVTIVPSSEKSVRGRQSGKQFSKDKADRSASTQRAHARRPHQPSPTRIPQQTDSSATPMVNPYTSQSFVHRDQDLNSFDPFVSTSNSDNEVSESTLPASREKILLLRAPPQLSSHPTGKLARRRQSGQAENFTPSKPVPAGRKGHKHPGASLSQSVPAATVTPQRLAARRTSTDVLPVADWDDFPVCDDMTVISTPTTPIRESASVPLKRLSVTWQQTLIDDTPRSAPLSSSFSYSFPTVASYATPSPANRRRNHRRVPSEGVFAMSMDEDSSSDSSDELRNAMKQMNLGGKPRTPASRRSPPPTAESAPASFYAGSIWQNSPSPDELPVPAFRA